MKVSEIREEYNQDPKFWPNWFSEDELQSIIKMAKEGDNPQRDSIIISGMVFLGLSAKEAADIRYCTVNGDAIERKGGVAFLHIPNAYRRMIYEALGDKDTIFLTDRLITCTKKEAEDAAEKVLSRIGISAQIGFMRLQRTAARLHYLNGWTCETEILNWFPAIKYISDNQKVLYYREKTDEEIHKEMKEALMKMPSFI